MSPSGRLRTSIALNSTSITIAKNGQFQFLAVVNDQFGDPLASQPSLFWILTGKGSITSRGLYKAPSVAGGPYIITVQSGTIKTTATITVV